jgi:hypothetical protein
MSPISACDVGSPTRQTSIASPWAAIQSRSAVVPSVAGPSSSPVIARMIAPSGGAVCTMSTAAATKAATPDFMSVAPRPYIQSPVTSAPKGGWVQAASSPTGTTSVWPLKPKLRAAPFGPQRANRFGVPLRSARVQANPASDRIAASASSAPPSAGVTVSQRSRVAVSAMGSVMGLDPPLAAGTSPVAQMAQWYRARR